MASTATSKTSRFSICVPDIVSGLPLWVSTEHDFIAEGVILKGRQTSSAKFVLANGLELSYGDIHMLAGDFYGTNEPISFGEADDGNPDDHETRFMKAFNTLATDPGSPAKAAALLGQIAQEADFVTEFVNSGQGTAKQAWEAWNNRDLFKLEDDSVLGQPGTGVDYQTLLELNVDHFGDYARVAYETGHKIAIATARSGDLETAYVQNAFAEHFLQDYFAGGHMRTPRKPLMADKARNICANMMHNEDCNNGLNVISVNKAPKKRSDGPTPMTETYIALGDDSLFEPANVTNLNQAIYAMQVSADEIYDAFRGLPVPEKPSAYLYTATPESIVRQDNNPNPMFWIVGSEVQMRLGLDDDNPPLIPIGDWQFESVVQPKVLLWFMPALIWDVISYDQQVELAWACVAWQIAPPGYYKDVAWDYVVDLFRRLWNSIGNLGDFETEVMAKIKKSKILAGS